jgi:isoquinoline 1-oxidoreductase beta subunit
VIVSRRAFVAGIGAATVGLALGFDRAARADGAKNRFAPNALVQIGDDGVVTIACHRSEMGQGVRSTLPVVIADELGADLAKIVVVQGDGDARFPDQDTDGSSSIRMQLDEVRRLAAAAREMLVAAAARRWRVPAARLVAKDGEVRDAVGNRAIGFGELAAEASKLKVPKSPKLRPIAELAHVGRELPDRDAFDQATGAAVYGADVRLPGMLYAVIARPPALYDRVARFESVKVPGVLGAFELEQPVEVRKGWAKIGFANLGGVAVVATNTWAALKGRRELNVEWKSGRNADHDSAAYTEQLLAAVRAPGEVVRAVGDADAALAKAATKIEAEYVVPYLAHAAMEPPAAVARVNGDRIEVWACTQSPANVQQAVSRALGVKPERVTVHVTLLGGGFGRKSFPDFAVEAALLARITTRPVRVQWTREDDLQHGTFHATCAQALAAGLDERGDVVAWRHRLAFPSINATFEDKERPAESELGMGITDLPLAAPNVSVQTGAVTSHVRVGWLRSVCNINHAFAVQSFVDELAHAAKRDPRDMLLAVLGPPRVLTAAGQGVKQLWNYGHELATHPLDVARLHRVIAKATELAEWDRARKAGRALGLAAHRSFGTYVAVVASVVKGPRGEVRVDEAWIACDAGFVVNPERVRYQMEGGFLWGMSNALHGAITTKRGAVEQTNFRDYRLARMPEAPRAIHVELLASAERAGGAGEPGVPPVAPAIANAAFALDGVRRRAWPLR